MRPQTLGNNGTHSTSLHGEHSNGTRHVDFREERCISRDSGHIGVPIGHEFRSLKAQEDSGTSEECVVGENGHEQS